MSRRARTPALLTLTVLAVAAAAAATAAAAEAHSDDPMRVHSQEHLSRHLRDLHLGGDSGDDTASLAARGRPEQQEYYYFKMHDLDNNDRLDGLELLKSLLDHQDDGGEAVRSDHQLAQTVEKILKDEDTNGDGYVDYTEFVAAQRRK